MTFRISIQNRKKGVKLIISTTADLIEKSKTTPVQLLKTRLGTVDIITGSNAFAHNDKPEKILEAAKHILNEKGHLCLELMYAGDLLEMQQWDTLYHEHLTFYSLNSLIILLKRHGFKIVHAERIKMHGGSLRISATLNHNEKPNISVAKILN